MKRILPLAAVFLLFGGGVAAQTGSPPEAKGPGDSPALTGGMTSGVRLLNTPVTDLFPGGVAIRSDAANPMAGDPESGTRGQRYFNQFNCVGCHAPNGGGGMGPSLSNAKFIYGGRPAEIYLSILQGRPNGMPAWGGMLPGNVIWDLVTYVQSISKEPGPTWGEVTSRAPMRPEIEQVPAEFLTTTTPWQHTTPFSAGQRPFEKPEK